VALDWFGRTAGLAGGQDGTGTRAQDFDWKHHIPKTTPETIDADIAAALGYLRERTRPDLPVITVGFCFGGSQSWRQSAGDLDLAGCVGFYGRPSVVGDAAARAHRPTLMLVAGADAVTPVAEQERLAALMRKGGAEVEIAVYDGAPHSFFDRSFGDWQEACDDAWRRILALTDRVAG
jgi:carboxymethylenebutenolidase